MKPITRAGLEQEGFQGFVPFEDLDLAEVPSDGGVYVVLAPLRVYPVFLTQSPAGRFKGKDPTVVVAVLEDRWVANSEVVYIGKATCLRKRLQQYKQFGAGQPVGHWGGRYVWQIEQARYLDVAWLSTPGQVPRAAEMALLARFCCQHGSLPFANLRR